MNMFENPFDKFNKKNIPTSEAKDEFDIFIENNTKKKYHTKGILTNFFNKGLYFHIVFFGGLIILLIFGFELFLKSYTNHNLYLEVPNFIGNDLHQAKRIAEDANIRIKVIDSMYIESKPLGSILDQTPSYGSLVKKNRRIYLTMNRSFIKKVKMPNLVGKNIIVGTKLIMDLGLKIGKITYSEDIASNIILSQKISEMDIQTGESVPLGSQIDLVVSKGINKHKQLVAIPNLIGLTIGDFEDKLRDYGIRFWIVNSGDFPDYNLKKNFMYVVKQYPDVSDGSSGQATMNKNTVMKLWISYDE